ncbi:hypothetical protein CR513_02462, partial [Mucuna pruriens]
MGLCNDDGNSITGGVLDDGHWRIGRPNDVASEREEVLEEEDPLHGMENEPNDVKEGERKRCFGSRWRGNIALLMDFDFDIVGCHVNKPEDVFVSI